MVIPGKRLCLTCKRPLTLCPNCESVVPQPSDVCPICTYQLRASEPDVPQDLRITPSPEATQAEPWLSFIADAYRAAVFANANMRSVVEALEGLRSEMLRETDFYRVWAAIDVQVGSAEPDRLRPVLASLRDRYVDHTCGEVVAGLQEIFRHDVDRGQRKWLRAYAEALSNWRLELCRALAQADFPSTGLGAPVADALPRLTRCLWQDQFLPTRELFVYLAGQEFVSKTVRARLLIIAALIRLYLIEEKPDQARQLLVRAQELAPDESYIQIGWGEYWLRQNDEVEAKQHLERAVQQAPDEVDGYERLGDLYLRQGELDAAEESYQQAMRIDAGDSAGPRGLIRLCGLPKLFPERNDRIRSLMKHAIAVSPQGEYATYLEVGSAYQQNGRFEHAQRYYDLAIALDESRVDGHAAKGNAFLEANDPDQAAEAFRRAIGVAPELFDGYWGEAQLFERQRKWKEALDAYQKSLKLRPEWAWTIPAKIAEMKWKLGEYAEAEPEVFDVLRSEPNNDAALNAAYAFADDYYKKRNDAEAALRIYSEIRDLKGEDEEANFQNRVGNVHYYNGDFRSAADAYALAIVHDPGEAVFHSNRGRALQELREWDPAQKEFEEAFKLDEDEAAYHEQMGSIFNAMGNAHYGQSEFREAIACYEEAIKHVPDDPVFLSNLALAWENIGVAGQRLAELEQAISALQRAIELQPDIKEYATRLSFLEHQRTLVQRYGELAPILTIPVVTPVAVEVSDNLVPKVDSRHDGGKFLYGDIPAMRERVECELGVRLPGVRFRANPALAPNTYQILIEEAPEEKGTARLGWRYCTQGPSTLEALHVPEDRLVPAPNPRTGEPGCWLPEEYWTSAADNGLELWTETAFLINHLEMVMRRNLPVFFGIQEAQEIFDRWAQSTDGESSEIPDWDLDARLGCARLLRILLDEQVPITAREEILAAISGRRLDGPGVVEAVRDVRLRLKRDLPGNAPGTERLWLPEKAEATLEDSLEYHDGLVSFGVPPTETHDLLTEIKDLLPAGGRNVALVVRKPEMRPFVLRLVAYMSPHLMVMSAEELVATGPAAEERSHG